MEVGRLPPWMLLLMTLSVRGSRLPKTWASPWSRRSQSGSKSSSRMSGNLAVEGYRRRLAGLGNATAGIAFEGYHVSVVSSQTYGVTTATFFARPSTTGAGKGIPSTSRSGHRSPVDQLTPWPS